jgi:hypothetical protein
MNELKSASIKVVDMSFGQGIESDLQDELVRKIFAVGEIYDFNTNVSVPNITWI